MSGLVGMVAKRGGEVLGVVVHLDPAGMVAVLCHSGETEHYYVGNSKGVTYHPADPAPAPAMAWARSTIAAAVQFEVQADALRQCLRTTLGLADDAGDEEIVAAVRSAVETQTRADLRAVWPSPNELRALAVDNARASGLVVDSEDWTADPPPPAPEGEERWYRSSEEGLKDPHYAVRGDRYDTRWDQPKYRTESAGGWWRLEEFAEREDERSPHPVLPPLWAADAWTTDPLPEPPETGSRWWGISTNELDGDGLAWIEQGSDGHWRHVGPSHEGSWNNEPIGKVYWQGYRRTVSPIARPEWCRE